MKLLPFESSSLRRWLGVGVALSFNNWVLSLLLNRRLLLKGGDISDLSSLTQPHHNLFRGLDIVAGLLLCGLGGLLIRRPRFTLGWLLIVLGISNVADALTALKCTSLSDVGCSIPAKINLHHLVLPSHIFSSTLIVVAMVLIYSLGLRLHQLRTISLLGLVTTALFLIFLLLAATDDTRLLVHLSALSQMLQMAIFGAWVILWAKPKTAEV